MICLCLLGQTVQRLQLSPSLYCLLHNYECNCVGVWTFKRPIRWAMSCWTRNSDLIWKAGRPRRWRPGVHRAIFPELEFRFPVQWKDWWCGWLLQTSWCRNPLSCSWPCRSVHHVPINLQQDKCDSLFCNFLSLYQWSPTFLPPGTCFLEDHFSTDQGMWAMGSRCKYRWSFAWYLALNTFCVAQFLTGCGPWPTGCGPLLRMNGMSP